MARRPFQSLAFPLTAHQIEALNSMLEALFREFRRGDPLTTGDAILPVDKGGSGRATALPYSVITGGISTTGQHQSVADVGTAGQVLTSQGAAALPIWDDVAATLDDLTDVVITSPQDGDILVYRPNDSDPDIWVNEQPTSPVTELDDLSDVVITSPQPGDILVYQPAGDSDPAQWINRPETQWSVLTNGDPVTPELIFAGGDVVMLHTP